LNVAVSRARAVFILVASPALFEPECGSPHQMQLANALCRLKEMARYNSLDNPLETVPPATSIVVACTALFLNAENFLA
jgi:hypothetical protein